MRERAKNQFPSVLLTLLSIIQALSLEVLWTSVHQHAYLWTPTFAALLGWLQVSTVLAGIVLVWLVYVSLVLRVVWVPAVADTVYPFAIGIMEFVMADMLEPQRMSLWFFLLAGIFAVSTRASLLALRSAREDVVNAELFSIYGTTSSWDRILSISFVGTLLLGGLVVQVFGSGGWLAFASLTIAIVTVAAQYRNLVGYWNRSLHVRVAVEIDPEIDPEIGIEEGKNSTHS